MNAWPKSDSGAIDRYLRSLPLHRIKTQRYYRCHLKAFQRFISAYGATPAVTEESVTAWLQARARIVTPRATQDRATKLSRFLDYLVSVELLKANPLTTMRTRYSVRTVAALVRALTSPEPARTLEDIRQPVLWGSSLGSLMRDHVALMQSMGYRYHSQSNRFRSFDRFLQSRPELAGQPLPALVRAWAAAIPTRRHAWECEVLARDLSRAWNRHEPAVGRLKADRTVREQLDRHCRRPHIYSHDEVRRALSAARARPAPRSPLVPFTTFMMVVLAYCAGLRIGEIVRLTLADVRLDEELLQVRNTKFFKSRRIPLHPSVFIELRAYLNARRRAGGDPQSSASLFWQEARACGYSRAYAEELIIEALRRAGIKPDQGRKGPRVHDFRHTFVVHRMLDWYQRGINPESQLPYLATYLGHRSIHSTLVYLTVTRELLEHASERFRRLGAASLHAQGGSP